MSEQMTEVRSEKQEVKHESRAEGREEQLFRCRKHRAEIMVNGVVYRLPSIYMGRQVRVRTEADGSLYDVRRMDGNPVSAVQCLSKSVNN